MFEKKSSSVEGKLIEDQEDKPKTRVSNTQITQIFFFQVIWIEKALKGFKKRFSSKFL